MRRFRKPVIVAFLLMPFMLTAIIGMGVEKTTAGWAKCAVILAGCLLLVAVLTIAAVRNKPISD